MSTFEIRVTSPAGDVVDRFDVTDADFETASRALRVGDRIGRAIEVHHARYADAAREMIEESAS